MTKLYVDIVPRPIINTADDYGFYHLEAAWYLRRIGYITTTGFRHSYARPFTFSQQRAKI
ncbi:MAG: hypothetical protein ACREAZ_09425 [Nitrososphaera sp.]